MSGCRERFFCDEMLARLGRWLRAAGYDVVIAVPGAEDRQLLQQARAEQRHFLTRDRKLLECHNAAGRVTLLTANQLAGQFAELSEHFAINWLCRPFSRCLECNSELQMASAEAMPRLPPGVRCEDATMFYCPRCDQLYWDGSHVKRMRRMLEHLSRGEWDANVEQDILQMNSEQSE
ncbi:MAG: Mut7-C RNAse domain-containing protein [Gammaproteobacteria bacterium]|nr:Mut7-C RNAse domain-containing protein [Gammaproteobacteria bacterium]